MFKRLIIVISMIILSHTIANANSIVGVKGGYFGWRPFLKDWNAPIFENIDIGYGFLGGPIIAIPLGDIVTISLTGLFGSQTCHWSLPYDQRIFESGGTPIFLKERTFLMNYDMI